MNIREAIEIVKEGKKVFNPKRTDFYHQNVEWVYYKCLHSVTKPNDLDEGWEVVE